MNKLKFLEIILNAAKQYNANLNNHNLMIIMQEKNKSISYFEIKFESVNFMHLTGVNSNLKANEFFQSCINNKLSTELFNIKSQTTPLKLQVLNDATMIDKTAKMCGEYNNNNNGYNLYTERLVGNISLCVGLIKDKQSEFYVPNTVLKEDIRNKTFHPVSKILCTLKKKTYEEKYNEICFIGKGVDCLNLNLNAEIINKLADNVKEKFEKSVSKPTENNLFEQSEKETNSTKHISDTTIDNKPQQDEILKKCICDKIMNNNPLLKHKLNIAAKEYFKKNNLSELPQNASVEERNQMRERVLNANPDLLNEYINAQKALEQSANNFTNDKPKVNENNVVEPTQTLPKKPKHKR